MECADAGAGTRTLHPADVLLPAALILWAAGTARTGAGPPGPYGLLTGLPATFYAGIALLVVSAAAELARDQPSRWRMATHAAALTVMLYGTAPLVYPEGRYSWLYKTVGIVQYVGAHGRLDPRIDIYQNWAGFFAFGSWLGKVAGVASPLAYAKWWQLVVELAMLPLLSLCYEALALPVRQRWVALLLFPAGNWIAQDYFSPQSLGMLLAVGIMAVALRWMPARARPPAPVTVLLVITYFVLTFTHELTPYIVLVQLGALAIAGGSGRGGWCWRWPRWRSGTSPRASRSSTAGTA